MTDQGKKYLTDIIHAIDLIESFSSRSGVCGVRCAAAAFNCQVPDPEPDLSYPQFIPDQRNSFSKRCNKSIL